MLLIDVSLGEPNKDDGNVALDFSMMVTSVTITYCGKLFSDYPTHYMLQNIERQQNLRNMLMLTLTKTNVTSTSYRQRLALEK